MKVTPESESTGVYEDGYQILSHRRASNEGTLLRKPINPYVISTSEDFKEERDFLRNVIFPEIDNVCRRRGTLFTPINTVWKSSHPQVAAGHGLTLALKLISHCTPFCIGLLGERYGEYRPDESPPLPTSIHHLPLDADWLDRNYVVAADSGHSWILGEAHQHCSFVELEIMQAAFLNDNEHCLFYFRQPEHVNDKFLDLPDHQREKKIQEYKSEDPESKLRLYDLKQRIIKKGLAVKYFRSLADLGKCVLNDWRSILDMLYPPLAFFPKPIGTEEFFEWTAQELFANTRREHFFITEETRNLMNKLSKLAESCSETRGVTHGDLMQTTPLYANQDVNRRDTTTIKPLIVLAGDRGSGKSTIIANWIPLFQDNNPDVRLIYHFVSASPRSADIAHFMLRFTKELRESYLDKADDSIFPFPSHSDLEELSFTEICESFMAAVSQGPTVIVIDGIDKLSSTSGNTLQQIKSLDWLTSTLPGQCRVILTTVQSDLTWKALQRRTDVQFLHPPAVDTLPGCSGYLQEYTSPTYHHLHRKHLLKLWECNWKLKTKPLFLSLLSNELGCFDVYDTMDVYIEKLTEMVGVRDYWGRCIQRWVATYSWTTEQATSLIDTVSSSCSAMETVAMTGWVPDALRLLAVSHYGLSQSELLSLLKSLGYKGRAEVTEFDWLLFRDCLGMSLYEGPGGLLNFSHHHLKECIEYTLLGCVRTGIGEVSQSSLTGWQKDRAVYHLHLASYFSAQENLERRVQELPWHLMMALEIPTLIKVISNPRMFLCLMDCDGTWPGNRRDLQLYWSQIIPHGVNPSQCYIKMLSDAGLHIEEDDQQGGASLMQHFHSRSPANESKLISKSKAIQPDLTTCNLSEIEKRLDNSVPAEQSVNKLGWLVYKFLSCQGETTAVKSILQAVYDNMFNMSWLSLEDELLYSEVQERLGGIYINEGDREQGETWYRKATQTLTHITDFEDTSRLGQSILCLKSKLLLHHGEMMLHDGFDQDAMEFYMEAQQCLELCNDVPLQATTLFKLGELRLFQGNYIESEVYFRECLTLQEKWFGECHKLVAETLFMLAQIILHNNSNNSRYNKLLAETLFRRTLTIQEKSLGVNHPEVSTTLLHLGNLVQANGGLSAKTESVRVLKRALDIRTTHFGSNDNATKEARQSLHDVQVSVKLGKYEFGPAKPSDKRTAERPYSSLSWRDFDLKNKFKESSPSRTNSSPVQRFSRLTSSAQPKQRAVSRTTASVSSRPSQTNPSIKSPLPRPSSSISGQSVSRPKSSFHRPQSLAHSTQTSSFTKHSKTTIHRKNEATYVQSTANDRPKSSLVNRQKVSRPLLQPFPELLENFTDVHISPQRLTEPIDEKSFTSMQLEVTSSKRNVSPASSVSSTEMISPSRTVPTGKGSTMLDRGSDEITPLASPSNVSSVTTPFSQNFTQEVIISSSEMVSPSLEISSPLQVQSAIQQYPVNMNNGIRPLSGPAQLYHHYGSAGLNKRSRPNRSVSATNPRTLFSNSNISLKSNYSAHSRRSQSDQTPPINLSDVYSLGGPKSSLESLLQGAYTREDFQKKTPHKSAWYHIPGRYVTPTDIVPPKRSQKRPGSAVWKPHHHKDQASGDDQVKLDDLETQSSENPLHVACHSAPTHVKFKGAVVVG